MLGLSAITLLPPHEVTCHSVRYAGARGCGKGLQILRWKLVVVGPLFQTGGRMKYTGLGLPKLSHISDVLDHLPFYSWLQGGSLLHSMEKTKSSQKPTRPCIVCTSWLATFPLWSSLWLFLLYPSQPPHSPPLLSCRDWFLAALPEPWAPQSQSFTLTADSCPEGLHHQISQP